VTSRNLLEWLKKSVPFAHGVVITTVPRGDLQVAQPANVGEPLLKAYAGGLQAEDCVTWQAILQKRVVRGGDCWGDTPADNPYYKALVQPLGLRYVVSVPLAAPVLDGYPGAVHLYRTADQGDFTDAEVEKLGELATKFDEGVAHGRTHRRGVACGFKPLDLERPSVHVIVFDADSRPLFPPDADSVFDRGLKNHMAETAKRYIHALNGTGVAADRISVADSHGDNWPFRVVSYKKYPALSHGPVTFFCLQPDCCEWGGVKPQDFGADPELSRLIPALKFMQNEFRRGPGLSEISGTVNLSPFHFHRRFTELLGLTPKQYMLACQIHEAKAELLAGEKELAQIAKDCGFAHQSHFTSRFKQATGLTPTRWRRMAQQRGKASNN